MENLLLPLVVNALLGVAMYFMKLANDSMKDRVDKLEKSIDSIKDTTVKKEDFREFKDELWVRFDRMELAVEKKLQQLER